MGRDRPAIKKRDDKYVTRPVTRIWQEQASEDNSYLAERCGCRGYDLLELMEKRSFVDVLFLIFQGELPSKPQADLLQALMIALINPGPRHPATRAAMNAGIGKTRTTGVLPIAMSVLGGDYLGGGEVAESMPFLKKSMKHDPVETASDLIQKAVPPNEGDWHVAPGFGCRFGGIDPMPQKIAGMLADMPGAGKAMQWASLFVETLKPFGLGWLSPGISAAVFLDLGFTTRAGAGLFQIIGAPGMLAHGIELANKPITAMPFIDGENCVIDPKAKKQKT